MDTITHPVKWIIGALAGTLLTSAASAAPMDTMDEGRAQAKRHLNMMTFSVNLFHHDAKGRIAATAGMHPFVDYFSLPESRQNQYDDLGRLQLSKAQDDIREEIETWTLNLHKRFPVAESCLIDPSGQEHMRVNGAWIETTVHFSREEQGAIFFDAGFKLAKGEVDISAPYMSMDALEWVVAFTTPIVLGDGSKPGIFHFEIPLSNYGRVISSDDYHFDLVDNASIDNQEEGRYLIIDNEDLLIADSRQKIRYAQFDERNAELNPDLPDYMPTERLSEYMPPLSSVSDHPAFLDAIGQMQNLERGIFELEIDGQPYVFAFEALKDQPWYIVHFDPVGGPAFWDRP